MDFRDEFIDECAYVICPISFPEYQLCDENCKHCQTYIDFVNFFKEREG